MTNRLVVIAGPANSGKMPLAKKLCTEDPSLLLVHRDLIRSALTNTISEFDLTIVQRDLAHGLLLLKYSVLAVAQNLHPDDQPLWAYLANEHDIFMEWLDTREPGVQAMIPPLEETTECVWCGGTGQLRKAQVRDFQ